jgi:DNA-binding response OmpR family regulator
MAEKSRIPTFRVRFESYDDFLVEYGDHLRKGLLVLPLSTETELDRGQKVRIKLGLPTGATLFLKGAINALAGDLLEVSHADGVVVTLASYTAEQKKQLEECVQGAALQEAPDEAPDSDPGRAMSLLLVDDSVAVRIELGDALREKGVRVRVAENGLVGIAAALKRPPDIILSDVEMPVMDGWTFLRMARARKRLADIPFVFFTRLTDDLSRLQGYRMGVEDYLAKDMSPAEVLVRLEGVLARTGRSARAADAGSSLRGDIEHVRLGSLLSFLETERRTGELHLTNGHDEVVVKLENGLLVDCDDLHGFSRLEDRVFDLLDWTLGEFEFVAIEVAASGEVEPAQVTYVLMEHARRADEAAQH